MDPYLVNLDSRLEGHKVIFDVQSTLQHAQLEFFEVRTLALMVPLTSSKRINTVIQDQTAFTYKKL